MLVYFHSLTKKSKKPSSSSSSHSHGNGALFPLPEGFFPKMTLSQAQVQRYERQIQQVVRDALAAYERHEAMGDKPAYCEPWRWMSSVESLIAVQSSQSHSKDSKGDKSDATKTTKSRIFGRINGDFRQQMDFYYAETARELVEWHQLMYGNTVDAAVLANIHTTSSDNPQHLYMGIKWLCVAAPRLLSRKRDQLFLEYLTFTTDLQGRDVGVRVTLPLELPECADLAQQLNVKRVKTHTVTILRAAANDRSSTEFFQMTETDSAVHYVNAAHYKKEMSVIKDMALFVDARRIAHQSLRSREQWVPRAERSACAICQRGFGATRRHHHCRLCGEVICGSCALVRKARKRAGDKKSAKTKVCLQCVTTIRESDSSSSVDFSASSQSFKLSLDGAEPSSTSASITSITSSFSSFSNINRRRRNNGASGHASTCDSEIDDDDDNDSTYGGFSDWDSASEGGDRNSSVCSSSTYEVDVDIDVDGSEYSRQRNSSSGSTISLAESSSSSSGTREKHSFMTTLDVIEDSVREEEPELVDFSKDLECLMLDGVTEVIDTKDMTPVGVAVSHTRHTTSSLPLKKDKSVMLEMAQQRPMRVHSTHFGSSNNSSASGSESLRSIGQCLAEQEELLKMMVFAASCNNSSKGRANSTTT